MADYDEFWQPSGSRGRQPTTYTYEEYYWWTPGPYTGMGPKGYVRSDEDILEDVADRLAANGQLDASDIEVTVNDHEVTLNGNVDNRRSKRLAEDIAESVFGVTDIHNNLRINKAAGGTRPANLRQGEEVVGSGGKSLGTVKEIHNHDFVLNRPKAADVHVPFTAVKDTSGNQVKLDVSADQIDKQGWTHI